ncbi:hypothetical protein SAY87_009941 [Trapa incisa]|uniref:Uncharacterized protein n=1 Tax=Trapa incisa TaxID=236973 RepID=A0AAN7GKR5_9MYRT|nr:hypothetical protein SAY87_009941 [Trapa incisa]
MYAIQGERGREGGGREAEVYSFFFRSHSNSHSGCAVKLNARCSIRTVTIDYFHSAACQKVSLCCTQLLDLRWRRPQLPPERLMLTSSSTSRCSLVRLSLLCFTLPR